MGGTGRQQLEVIKDGHFVNKEVNARKLDAERLHERPVLERLVSWQSVEGAFWRVCDIHIHNDLAKKAWSHGAHCCELLEHGAGGQCCWTLTAASKLRNLHQSVVNHQANKWCKLSLKKNSWLVSHLHVHVQKAKTNIFNTIQHLCSETCHALNIKKHMKHYTKTKNNTGILFANIPIYRHYYTISVKQKHKTKK